MTSHCSTGSHKPVFAQPGGSADQATLSSYSAEKILRSHVIDATSFRRNKQTNLVDSLADWSKWIGFTFIGFAVQQWIHIQNEKPIASGSVTRLVLDVIIAASLIVIGLMLNKPWGYFTDLFRRR
jgi:hypothetical protein